MSLLDEIRSDLTNESATLSNTLRKAKILASAIGLEEFREWVDSELDGYNNRDKVPSYRRRFRPTNIGTFVGPFQSEASNMVLPTYNLPEVIKYFAENLIFFDGVGALEAQAADGSQITWPQEMILLARGAIHTRGDMVLVDAHKRIPAYIFSGILDQVKNKLLDFMLGLQENNITSEDLDNRTVEPELARNLFQIHIYGDHNIVASGEHVSQQVNLVQKGDIDSLLSRLRELKVDDEDLSELKNAVSQETAAPSRHHYGPKVGAWFGKMMSQAATSAWTVSLETASKVLQDALNAYYFGS